MRRDFARFSEEPGCLTYCANAVWRRRVCGSDASNGTCSSKSIKRSIGFGNGSHHDARLQRSVSSLVVAPPASGYRPEIVTSVKNASQQFPHNPRMSNQRVFFYPISPSGSAAASTRQRFCDVKPSSPPHQTTAPEAPQARGQALARLSPRARRHGRNPRGTPPLKRPRKHRIN